jgi:hypothetical protein
MAKIQGISGFLDFIHRPVFEETRRFGNWICFRPQVKGGKKTPTQLGPLGRVNLSPSSQPFRNYNKNMSTNHNARALILVIQVNSILIHLRIILINK